MAAAAAIVIVISGARPAEAAPRAQAEGVVSEEIMFQGSGVALRGLIVMPESVEAGHPGVVLVHGAGPQSASNYLREAEAFAREGIVALVYDKRTEGYSLMERSYALLAEDVIEAVSVLRDRPEVDPARVGVWGLSEGGWVAPLAASHSEAIAFLITVAGTGVSPARQEAWARSNRLRHAGVSGSLLWAYAVNWTRFSAATGLFAEATFDPVPVLERVSQPVLGIWGEYDQVSPPAENLRIFRETLEQAGNRHVTLRVVPDAGHGARLAVDGGFAQGNEFAPGYVDLMTSWVNGLAAGPPASDADPPPPQEMPSPALRPLRWYESAEMQLATMVLILLAAGTYTAVAIIRRIRGDRQLPPANRPARWLAGMVLISWLGLNSYFIYLLMTNEEAPGPTLLGRPLPWAILQLLAVATVAALAATIVAWWRARAGHLGAPLQVRLGLLVAAGVVFVPWAVFWGLLVP